MYEYVYVCMGFVLPRFPGRRRRTCLDAFAYVHDIDTRLT